MRNTSSGFDIHPITQSKRHNGAAQRRNFWTAARQTHTISRNKNNKN
jgi:hypothetical protein